MLSYKKYSRVERIRNTFIGRSGLMEVWIITGKKTPTEIRQRLKDARWFITGIPSDSCNKHLAANGRPQKGGNYFRAAATEK